MSIRIKKAAVLGSGIMGSGIACHFANIGLEVVLLDIVPFDLSEDEKNDPRARNRVVNSSLKKAIRSKPAPLYDTAFASRITTGNFDDNLDLIADCDWVIEVIIERLDIKKQLFEKVDRVRRKGSIITSNTSGIPIGMLAEGRSDDFQKHFCGTHFFNPPRYLRLLEVIPHEGTDPAIVEFFMEYGDVYLGKKTVQCKDTPAFIGNRIGFYSGARQLELTGKYDLKIEEVDMLTGVAIARPKTGTFRLQDLVGLDTSDRVTRGVIENCPDDEYVQKIKNTPTPRYFQFLLDNNYLGNKSGQGFYKKTNEKDERGRTKILSLDLDTLEYRPSIKPELPSLKISKKIELIDKRIKELIQSEDKGGQFLKDYFLGLFAYASNRIPEISEQIYPIDDAMTAGYAWDHGPFEYWDMIGVKEGMEMAEAQGEKIAPWVHVMVENGHRSFYTVENGVRKVYDPQSGKYRSIPGTEGFVFLDNYRHHTPVIKNSECSVHDIGDGVLCLEFQSKANAIGQDIGLALEEAIRLAEEGDWKGLIIGNHAKNFSVGANLMGVGMLAMQKDFKTLEQMVKGFQDVVMRLRYSTIPTAIATQGYVFGGACEMSMHADAALCAAESYIGLVEVGVGLLPGGGGTKEMALRASEKYFEGDVQIPTLIEHFKPIAMASVATSAFEAYNFGLLLEEKDDVVFNAHRNIAEAKKRVLEMADNYVMPIKKEDVTVLGRSGLATLYTAINEFRLGEYMSDYDVEIARKIGWVMCGADLTGTQQVGEDYLLELEREAFLSLLGNSKTLERIQYMLMNNKPLRN